MARPVWKGAISFGLVTIPVSLHTAVERRNELAFHQLHEKDGSRIDYKRFCAEEQVEIPWSEIVKGYEVSKGEYVVMTDEDFENARAPATQTIDITDFVHAHDVDPLYFDQPYYVAPSGKAGTKAYALLRDALEDTGRIGIGTLVMRQREHLVGVGPADGLLTVTTMRWAHEIRSRKDLDVPEAGQGWSEKEMKLARQLVETLESDWEPGKYKDTYYDVLREIIEKKAAGEKITAAKLPKVRPVANLMKALEQSLKTRKDLAHADARSGKRQVARSARKRRAAA